jgi:hypothetical protein
MERQSFTPEFKLEDVRPISDCRVSYGQASEARTAGDRATAG